jgi:hypothetical protein
LIRSLTENALFCILIQDMFIRLTDSRYKHILFKLLAVCLILAFGFWAYCLCIPQSVQAQTAQSDKIIVRLSPAPEGGPANVKVGVYVLNLGKLDTSTGTYTIDFYLILTSDKPVTIDKFEFSNGRSTSIDKSVDDPQDKFYRIQASLGNTLNLSRYPFDRHQLTIEMEDKEQTVNSLVYQVSREDSGVDPAVKLAGWDITGWDAAVSEHYYAPWQTTFSKYVFSIDIQRSDLAAILKTILPAFIIVVVGLLSLVLSPDKIIPRLTLNTGAFTAAVLFHLNMTSSLPPLGYLTLGDRFMLFNYLALSLALISTLVALFYVDKKRNEAANHIHKIALIVVPVLWVILEVLNFTVL